jgi:2-polyprenyl-3-methyl-5-hydroxy-6-metoxy-1,4-benzoquinol methylase
MIDRDVIRSCYRAVLGRMPESEAIEAEKALWSPDLESLLADLLASSEFQNRIAGGLRRAYEAPPSDIEVDMTPVQRDALFDRLRRQWQAMGETEPYWSVITFDEFRTENLDPETKSRFFASGSEHGHLLDLFAQRCGTSFRDELCVEIGCGVGRVTKHLAGRFRKVIAIDISEGNLREARAMAAQERLTNIDFQLLSSPGELERLPDFDVLYSTMVFQHNPPPVQKYQLDVLLGKIRTKGAFFFQAQTVSPGYRFRIEEHLRAPLETMDMHCLPMHEILALIRKHRLPIHEVAADYFTGLHGSYTFFGGGRPKRRGLSRLFG